VGERRLSRRDYFAGVILAELLRGDVRRDETYGPEWYAHVWRMADEMLAAEPGVEIGAYFSQVSAERLQEMRTLQGDIAVDITRAVLSVISPPELRASCVRKEVASE